MSANLLPTIQIKGPFWSAAASIITSELATNPVERSALARILFVDSTPKKGGGKEVYLAGTLLALCAVNSVEIRPAGANPIYAWQRPAGATIPALNTPQ